VWVDKNVVLRAHQRGLYNVSDWSKFFKEIVRGSKDEGGHPCTKRGEGGDEIENAALVGAEQKESVQFVDDVVPFVPLVEEEAAGAPAFSSR